MSWVEKQSSNKINSVEKQENKKNKVSELKQSQKDFIESKLIWDVNFFDNFDTENIIKDFISFLKTKDNYSDISIEVSDYSANKKETLKSQLKYEVLKVTVPRKNNLKKIKEKYELDFDFWKNEKKLLTQELRNLHNDKLISLINYPSKMLNFLVENNIFDSKDDAISRKKHINDSVKKHTSIDTSKLSEEEKTYLFNIFNTNTKISVYDLDFIYSNVLLSDEQKFEVMKYFLENISLLCLQQFF